MPVVSATNFRRPGSCLVNGDRAHLLAPDEFGFMQNWKPWVGNIVVRGGLVQQADAPTAATVRWLHLAYGDNTSTALRSRMRLCGTVLSAGANALSAWTAFATGLTAGTFPVAVSYKDEVWWCDGVNTALRITIADPPVDSSWGGLPSGINPSWVVLHFNRLYYGGDLTTPTQVWMTDPGAPATTTATNVYNVPDDQNGNYPKIAVNCFDGISLFCQDFIVYLRGVGPLTHTLKHFPRGAACIAWRSVVNMGEFGNFYLTERGVFNFDGNTFLPVDPYGRVNVSDFDMTTEENTWAFRVGDEYRIYFKSKGNTTTTATATSRMRSSVFTLARTRLTIATTGDAQTGHYYSYDCRLKQWSGPHTGNHLCGAWEQYRYGDRQDPWVGDSTTAGEVYKADEQTYTDDGTPIDCILRTGAIGDPMGRTKIDRIKALFGICEDANAVLNVRIYQDGHVDDPPVAQFSVPLGRKGSIGPPSSYNPPQDREDFVLIDEVPDYKGQQAGVQPIVEFRLVTRAACEFRGYTIYYQSQE